MQASSRAAPVAPSAVCTHTAHRVYLLGQETHQHRVEGRGSPGLSLVHGHSHVMASRHLGLTFNLLCFKWEICEDQISSNPGQISLKIFDLYKQENEV